MTMDYPRILNVGSGKDRREDCLNLDIDDTWSPDIVADLNQPFFPVEPRTFRTERFGEIAIGKNAFDAIIAHDVLEHLPHLITAMKNCLDLLREGGQFDIVVPYDLSHVGVDASPLPELPPRRKTHGEAQATAPPGLYCRPRLRRWDGRN